MGDRPTAWAQQMQRLHGPTRRSPGWRALMVILALVALIAVATVVALLAG